MDPTLVPGTRFESQFQICVYEHAILRIYIIFFSTIGIRAYSCISDLILILWSIYLYYKSYTCITELILVLHMHLY